MLPTLKEAISVIEAWIDEDPSLVRLKFEFTTKVGYDVWFEARRTSPLAGDPTKEGNGT